MSSTSLLEAAWALHDEFLRRRADRERRLTAAREAADEGRLDDAARAYLEMLGDDRANTAAWDGLAQVHAAQTQWQQALDAALTAIAIDPARGRYHRTAGLVFANTTPSASAIQRYQEATLAGGRACSSLSELESTLAAESARGDAASAVRLGNVQMAAGRPDLAVVSYGAALRLAPSDAIALDNLAAAHDALGDAPRAAMLSGAALLQCGEPLMALRAYQQALAGGLVDEDAFVGLGDSYRTLDQHEEAAASYADGLKAFPASAPLHLRLASTLNELGRTSDALRAARRGARACPDNLSLQLEHRLMLPVVYRNAAEISRARERFTRGLARASRRIRVRTKDEQRQAQAAIASSTNFFLAYQGRNDRALQMRYGRLVTRIMHARYPQWSKPRPMPAVRRQRIRIGYVSAYMRRHAVASSHLGWLRHADRDRFAIHAYFLGAEADSVTDVFRRSSEVFRQLPGDLTDACAQIADDDLHVLVYLDIGMFPRATQMAALHLAPVQCTTWGHPVTSGLPSIEYYFSSNLMEPARADTHYSERLIRLPGLGVAYARPDAPQRPKPRRAYGIPDEATLFLCAQSPYKYLPQDDDVLVQIARKVPDSVFVFVASHPAAGLLERRIRSAFARARLDAARMIHFVPRQPWPDYLGLMLAADVFLDTFEWSACNTALEALALHLPIVTCPGRYLRGRHSYAFFNRMGLTETVASDRRGYVETAVRLARDRRWRERIRARIAERVDRLYEDRSPVRALEEFYQRVVTRAR